MVWHVTETERCQLLETLKAPAYDDHSHGPLVKLMTTRFLHLQKASELQKRNMVQSAQKAQTTYSNCIEDWIRFRTVEYVYKDIYTCKLQCYILLESITRWHLQKDRVIYIQDRALSIHLQYVSYLWDGMHTNSFNTVYSQQSDTKAWFINMSLLCGWRIANLKWI